MNVVEVLDPLGDVTIALDRKLQLGAFVQAAAKVSVQEVAPVPAVIVPAASFPTIDGEDPHEDKDGVELEISICPPTVNP